MKKETGLYIVIAILVLVLAVLLVHDIRVYQKASVWESEAKSWANVSIYSSLALDKSAYALEVCTGEEVFDPEKDKQIRSEWEKDFYQVIEWINSK